MSNRRRKISVRNGVTLRGILKGIGSAYGTRTGDLCLERPFNNAIAHHKILHFLLFIITILPFCVGGNAKYYFMYRVGLPWSRPC